MDVEIVERSIIDFRKEWSLTVHIQINTTNADSEKGLAL